MIDDKLINPIDKNKVTLEQDWSQFEILIKEQVFPFQETLSGRYHPHTYVLYGDDKNHKTWGDVVWRRSLPKPNLFFARTPLIAKPLELEGKWDSRTGAQRVIDRAKQPVPQIEDFVLQPAEENGDGTVPVRSGRAPSRFAKVCVAFEGIDHEGAYNPLPCRLFALRAITRLVGNVKGTSMEYVTC
ncbi:hypothetical protein WJ30_23780 [Burkholderia diffusa]|nr:hypothetical protein WJ30_23780 [Burkholderia diffusa]